MIFFRDAVLNGPKWLKGWPNAYRLLSALGSMLDHLSATAFESVAARWPGYSEECDALIAQHRRITFGPNEPAASRVRRLSSWRQDAKRSGNRWLMLESLQALFAPATPVITIVGNDGNRDHIDAAGVCHHDTPLVWDWDGHTEMTSRFWVLIDNAAVGLTPGAPLWDDPRLWDDPLRLWDFEWNIWPPLLRTVVEQLRPPHAFCDCIILMTDEAAFMAALPDGDWDNWDNRSTDAYYLVCTEFKDA